VQHQDVPNSFDGPMVSLDAAFAQDPLAVYERLRPDGPVHRVVLPRGGGQAWMVIGLAEAREALLDRRLVTCPGARRPPLAVDLPHPLVLDGPDHLRLRKLLTSRFSRSAVEALRHRTTLIADGLLDRFAPVGGQEHEVDLLQEYAFPLPTAVLHEVLGLPGDPSGEVAALLRSCSDPSAPATAVDAWAAFTDRVRTLVEAKRFQPGDDLLTDLLRGQQDGVVTAAEVVGTVRLLLQVGDETLWHLLGNAILSLVRRPALLAQLRSAPSLLPRAVDELLRHDGPVNSTVLRYATAETAVGGRTVHAGEAVLVALTGAAHDPREVPHADELHLDRDNARALGYGWGAHYCVGAGLARMQAEVALSRLLLRCESLRLSTESTALRRRPVPLLHGWEALPLKVSPRTHLPVLAAHHP